MIYSKALIKEKALAFRNQLSEEDHIRLSMLITYRLCYIYPFKEAQNYHFFIGSAEKREIITKPLIEILANSGRNVFVPKVNELTQLSAHQIRSLSELKKGAFNIEEPTTPASTRTEYDCLIIPMLGADLKGNRLGYGKGFYDVFLSKVKGTRIGLVYDDCLVDEIESEKHDIPMDMIITEKRIIEIQ